VWDWVDEHPGPATLVHLHTPAATRRAAELRREFDDLHVQRAFAYVDDDVVQTPIGRAQTSLVLRVLVDLLIAIHPPCGLRVGRLARTPRQRFATW
jgi:hypothetical protein